MSDHFVRHIPGMGYQVVSKKKGHKATFDDRDEAEAHKDELNNGLIKEHESEYWKEDL